MTDRNTIHALKQVLTEGFDLEELHDICFRLDIDKDELPSTTKTSFINALLDLIDRHNQIPDLIETGRTLRDQLDWPQLPSERLRTLKQAIGQQDSEAVDEIFPELIAYIKRLEKQGITEIDETLLEMLEMFGKGDIPGTKLVRIWHQEQAKKNESTTQDINYADLADRLQHGEIVLFLGGQRSHALVDGLARVANYDGFQGSFSEICEYMEGDSRQTMLRKVNDIQAKHLPEDDSARKSMCELLSKVSQPLLLVSATYDSDLEDTFRVHNKPFKVLSHPHGTGSGGNILMQDGAGGAPQCYTTEQLSELAPQEKGFSLIYKIRGCFRFIEATPSSDTLTLSERDYFRFAKDIDKLIPDYLARQLQGRSLWFFGHHPDTWEERLLIQAVLEKNPSSTLAIHPEPNPFAEAYWKARKIDLYRLEPKDFIDKLGEELHA